MRIVKPFSAEEIAELRDKWHWIYDDDGNMLEEKVLAELSDFGFVLSQVPSVYAGVTGDAMSKPNYYAKDVLAQYEEHVQQMIDWAVEDALKEVVEMIEAGDTPADAKRKWLNDE